MSQNSPTVQFLRLRGTAFLAVLLALVPLGARAEGALNILQPQSRGMLVWPIHIGDMLGFYAAEGLSLNLVATDAALPYTIFLDSGDADLVMMDSLDVLQAASAGIDIASIYTTHAAIPHGVWVSEASGIVDLKGLKGQTIGLGSDRDRLVLDLNLAKAGLAPEDVETVVVGDSGTVLSGVFTHGFAAGFAGSVTSVVPMIVQGIRLRQLVPAEDMTTLSMSFVVRADRMEELREPICGFLRAWSKGAYIGGADIEIVAAMSRHPNGVPEVWEDPAFGYGYLHQIADYLLSPNGRFGAPDAARLTAVQAAMFERGLVEIKAELGPVLDESFVECANDFDRGAAMAAARAWMDDPANAAYVRRVQ